LARPREAVGTSARAPSGARVDPETVELFRGLRGRRDLAASAAQRLAADLGDRSGARGWQGFLKNVIEPVVRASASEDALVACYREASRPGVRRNACARFYDGWFRVNPHLRGTG
jgi:hypothetical protein